MDLIRRIRGVRAGLMVGGMAAAIVTSSLAFGASEPARSDAPAMPKKGEYKWEEPKDWTPPALAELQAMTWEDGRLTTGVEVARARYAAYKPTLTEAEALTLDNVNAETNEKILAVLSRPPKDPSEVDYDATINFWIGGAPETLSAIFQSTKYEQEIVPVFSPAIMTFDHDMVPYADGDLVKRWQRSPTMDLFTMRADGVWEDGTPITAYDLEFSYHVIMDDRVTVPAVRSTLEDVKWVKAYDPTTLVVFHKAPRVTNIWNVNFPVVPKHIYSPGMADDPTMRTSEWNIYWNLNPLSGAMYRLKEHQPGQLVLFERRDQWYLGKDGKPIRDKPYAKTLRFRIIQDENAALLGFKKGDIDEMLLRPPQWMNGTSDEAFKSQGVKVNGVEWTFNWIGWNIKPIPDNPFFKDVRVRQAMSYTFDYDEYLKKLNYGLYDAAGSMFHPLSWMHNPETQPYAQDLDKAEELLDAAGWSDSDGDGIRDKTVDGKKWDFNFTMTVPLTGLGEATAVLMKEDLSKIGVKMEIKKLEFATFISQAQEHKFEALTMAFGTGTDPDTAKNLWKTEAYDNGRNTNGYSNPRVDELFDAGAKEFDLEKRKKIYQEIDLILNKEQPYTFLAFRRCFWGFNKRLRGYNFSPREPFGYTPGPFAVWVPKSAS